MQDSKKNKINKNSNNSKNNLIGLSIFVGMFILIVIVIVILTKSILPGNGSSASSMLVADSNLGIHTDTTTEPVTVKSNKNDSSQSNDYDNEYDSDNDIYNDNNEQGTVMTVSSSVNVRSGPGSKYTQIGELAAGREVTVYENVNGWYRISFNGSTNAYVYSGYISGSLPESTSSSSYNEYSETTPTYTSYAQLNQNNNFNNDSNSDDEYYYNYNQ